MSRLQPIAAFVRAISILLAIAAGQAAHAQLPWIQVSVDGKHFVRAAAGKQADDQPGARAGDGAGEKFVVWGVNYDHDTPGRLLEDYWVDEWPTVVEDFQEIKALGANVVRIHLQLGKFMQAPDRSDNAALEQLSKLVKLAEDTGLYLDLTGLNCYHKKDVPPWYDALSEKERWAVQAEFWRAVARTCRESPAIFCYDLMNEPILPGEKKAETEWLAGELGGKFFVQRLTLDLAGRSREDVAKAWVDQMVAAIREHDQRHMITVGVIPWALVFPGAKPLFYSPRVGEKLDFVSVHFYPKKGEIGKALEVLKVYEVGKPLVIEETFPLGCGIDELIDFIDRSSTHADGWISFYWGTSIEDLAAKPNPTISEAIIKAWLERFKEKGAEMTAGRVRGGDE